MNWLYTIRETFFASSEPKWQNYLAFSGLAKAREIVSLDCMLCPDFIDVSENLPGTLERMAIINGYGVGLYSDIEFLKTYLPKSGPYNLLRVAIDTPEAQIDYNDAEYDFCGFDLLDQPVDVSAITNCGGFPETFSNEETNEYGLLSDLPRARAIQINLLRNNPEEHHADCILFHVYRHKTLGRSNLPI